jgi:hypothetical protein
MLCSLFSKDWRGTRKHKHLKETLWLLVRSLDFSVDLFIPATLWSSSQLSLQQKKVPRMFLGVEGGQHVRLKSLPSSVSQLSGKCGSLNTSQSYGPPRSVTRIALPFIFLFSSTLLGCYIHCIDLVMQGIPQLNP